MKVNYQMQIEQSGSGFDEGTDLQAAVHRQLQRAFHSFRAGIHCIELRLSKKNVAEGEGYVCHLVLQLATGRTVNAEACHRSILTAVIRAADRGRRSLTSNLPTRTLARKPAEPTDPESRLRVQP